MISVSFNKVQLQFNFWIKLVTLAIALSFLISKREIIKPASQACRIKLDFFFLVKCVTEIYLYLHLYLLSIVVELYGPRLCLVTTHTDRSVKENSTHLKTSLDY